MIHILLILMKCFPKSISHLREEIMIPKIPCILKGREEVNNLYQRNSESLEQTFRFYSNICVEKN